MISIILPGKKGRELLYHEVAHVLQQSGGAKKNGIISAKDIKGAGPVQFQIDDMAAYEVRDNFKEIIELYQKQRLTPDLDTF